MRNPPFGDGGFRKAFTHPTKTEYRRQVGTVVELHAPDAFEVEFNNDNGRTYALLALRAKQLLVLHYQPLQMA